MAKGMSSKKSSERKTEPTLAMSQKTCEFHDLVIVCLLVCGDSFIVELNVQPFCGFVDQCHSG